MKTSSHELDQRIKRARNKVAKILSRCNSAILRAQAQCKHPDVAEVVAVESQKPYRVCMSCGIYEEVMGVASVFPQVAETLEVSRAELHEVCLSRAVKAS